MPEKFTITSIAESFRLGDDGSAQQTKQILFRVGKDGPFSIEVPTEEFEPDHVNQLLEAEAEKILKLRGLSEPR